MLSNSPCNTLLVRVHYETWSMDRSLDLIMDSITLFKFWVKIDVHTNQQQSCDVMCMLSIVLTGIVIQLYSRCVGYCKYPQYIHLSTYLFMYQFIPGCNCGLNTFFAHEVIIIPKLHLGRSCSKAMRPPSLIYCTANRVLEPPLQQSRDFLVEVFCL